MEFIHGKTFRLWEGLDQQDSPDSPEAGDFPELQLTPEPLDQRDIKESTALLDQLDTRVRGLR
jgi:hypothetical protein